jgi:hypothetical protein
MGRRGSKKIVAPAPAERRAGLRFCIQNHEGYGADGRKKRKSIGNWRDRSERTYQHSNFMTCGVVIRMHKGARREERTLEDSVNEQDNGETVDANLPKGTDI